MRTRGRWRSVASVVALAGALNWTLAGCARSWPQVKPIGDRAFLATGAGVVTVDVLPIDVEITTHPGSEVTADDVAEDFDDLARQAVAASLLQRGYQVGAVIDWDGTFVAADGRRVAAFQVDQLETTALSLGSYGWAQAQAQRRDATAPLDPWLPVKLGQATQSDATLYIGGYAFAGQDPSGIDGEDIVKGVFIAVFIIVVVAVILSRDGGGVGRAAGNAAGVVGRAAAGVGRAAARGVAHVARNAEPLAHAALEVADAFGRSHTHLQIVVHSGQAQPAPPERGRSRMLIEMTLVENATGRTLWHARQQFAANPARPKDVVEVMARMLKTLPAHR